MPDAVRGRIAVFNGMGAAAEDTVPEIMKKTGTLEEENPGVIFRDFEAQIRHVPRIRPRELKAG